MVGAVLVALLALLPILSPCPARAEETPATVVDQLHGQMIEVMKDAQKLGFQGRFDRLEPALQAAYDLPYMAEKAIGRHWAILDEAQRARWVKAFSRSTIATYAGRITAYSGQRFERLGDDPAPADTTLVRTRLFDPGHEDVDLNYRLRKGPAGWRIIDVYMQGTVSELALRRSDYTAVLDRQGFDALLATAEAKVADAAAGRGAPSPTP